MGDAEKTSIRGGDASHKRETLFIGNAGSHYILLMYCETLLKVLLGIYCKRFYCVRGWQGQKCNSKCPNDINTDGVIPETFLGF